ncbi:MAG: thioesterase family protein [Pseudomonadota bacterium]
MSSAPRAEAPGRDAFAVFRPLTTRWADNDIYGHLNNVVYYALFDTAVNGWLCDAGLLDVGRSPVIGLVVSSQCDYFSSVAFPDALEAGLRVDRVGRSSVTYGVGIFREDAPVAAAAGRFTHVYVTAADHRPTPLSDAMRTALRSLDVADKHRLGQPH